LELGTTDQQGAKAFYSGLFGWTANDSPMGPDAVYTIFQLDGSDAAAAYQLDAERLKQGVPPHWMVYIATDDADVTASKANKFGGEVLAPPLDVMDHGRMAVLRDPTGAVFSIWQAKSHKGVQISGEEGSFCWADLNSPHPEKAKRFYQKLFDWQITEGSNRQSGYMNIQHGEEYIGGIPAESDAEPGWLIYFETADCDGLSAKAQTRGAKLLMPPLSMPNVGRISCIADPQGAVFALYEPLQAA
jgi:hypothetical protein